MAHSKVSVSNVLRTITRCSTPECASTKIESWPTVRKGRGGSDRPGRAHEHGVGGGLDPLEPHRLDPVVPGLAPLLRRVRPDEHRDLRVTGERVASRNPVQDLSEAVLTRADGKVVQLFDE
ncbi:MAG: hypothetical protein R3E97_07100 [Candidatus Eisenbacteria bacterium]